MGSQQTATASRSDCSRFGRLVKLTTGAHTGAPPARAARWISSKWGTSRKSTGAYYTLTRGQGSICSARGHWHRMAPSWRACSAAGRPPRVAMRLARSSPPRGAFGSDARTAGRSTSRRSSLSPRHAEDATAPAVDPARAGAQPGSSWRRRAESPRLAAISAASDPRELWQTCVTACGCCARARFHRRRAHHAGLGIGANTRSSPSSTRSGCVRLRIRRQSVMKIGDRIPRASLEHRFRDGPDCATEPHVRDFALIDRGCDAP